ncbi:MAG: TonB-dependent receptor, partial [Proteobacteria bacterium]|nr:TonB-dependent receptor [Pseudomonadota bacterium]
MSADEALKRLLAGSGCTYRYIDQRAVEIVPAARPTSPPAMATPPTTKASDASISELIVVATRQATAADRLAYPVSLVTGRTLERQGLTDDNALATAVPAMVVTNLGAGRDKILLRGLSDGPLTGRTQSMVGIYLDDVRLTYNAPDPDLKLVDIEQVEVLRGPQGALYGSGSLGGVVHLVTARPDPTALAGTITAGVGFTADGSPSDDVEGVLNLPTPWAGGALRIVGYRELQGGYI